MRRALLGAAGAFVIAAVAFSGNAQAQCWWNGFDFSCAAPPVTYYEPAPPQVFYPTPYAAWNAWDYRDYRYNPSWLPSYPGPKASSSTFGRY
jgi:hypothetical protein